MMSEKQRRGIGAAGVFLVLLGVFLLTAPGRIETIDGQWRYEVARNWLDYGVPEVRDPVLCSTGWQVRDPATGRNYCTYNALASITPMPLMALSRLLPGHNVERDRFLFSLAGPIFGALLGALLFFAYGLLRIGLRQSLLCTAIFCLTTLWWPGSLTVLDQNQHAVLLLASVLLGWQAGRRQSLWLASLAGVVAGLLVNYQEVYGLLLPALGISVLASPTEGTEEDDARLRRTMDRTGLRRYFAFGLGCCVGVGLFLAFNYLRFGTPLLFSRYRLGGDQQEGFQEPMWGDPLVGLLGLLISPGKGILWFSPPLILALLGARALWARAPVLSLTIASASSIYLVVVIQLACYAGDWCWGPRYALPVMPLWALALPYVAARLRHSRRLVAPIAVAGLLIQVMGVSLDHHRFFYQRQLPVFFWVMDPWIYFKHSQLLARPGEILEGIRTGLPREATRFSSTPDGQITYSPLVPPNPQQAPVWMRQFQVFHLPRPWWGWLARIPQNAQPVNPGWLFLACGALLIGGCALLVRSLTVRSPDPALDCRDSESQDAYPCGPMTPQTVD